MAEQSNDEKLLKFLDDSWALLERAREEATKANNEERKRDEDDGETSSRMAGINHDFNAAFPGLSCGNPSGKKLQSHFGSLGDPPKKKYKKAGLSSKTLAAFATTAILLWMNYLYQYFYCYEIGEEQKQTRFRSGNSVKAWEHRILKCSWFWNESNFEMKLFWNESSFNKFSFWNALNFEML